MGLPTILDRSTQARAVWLANGTSDQAAGDASNPFIVGGNTYTFISDQQIVEPASSTALTVPATATVAIVQNNGTQNCRFRYEGATNAPTATLGQRIYPGEYLTINISNTQIANMRFIREAAGCTLDIVYLR